MCKNISMFCWLLQRCTAWPGYSPIQLSKLIFYFRDDPVESTLYTFQILHAQRNLSKARFINSHGSGIELPCSEAVHTLIQQVSSQALVLPKRRGCAHTQIQLIISISLHFKTIKKMFFIFFLMMLSTVSFRVQKSKESWTAKEMESCIQIQQPQQTSFQITQNSLQSKT